MSDELAKQDPRDIQLGSLELTAVGLAGNLAKPPSVDDFRSAMAFIGRAAGASNWWIGDLANHADKWGDEYVQLLDELGTEYDRLRDCAYVAKSVSLAVRTASLPWSHHKAVSALTPPEQKRWLRKAQPKAGEAAPRLSVSELKKAIREERIEKERAANPLPPGTFRVIYADPPWKYSDELIEGYGAAEHHYPSLSIGELCELADGDGKTVKELAQPDAVLFLWTTSPLLEKAFEVVAAWGFSYKTTFVWDKVRHNYGHYNSVRHELLLLCTRGSCTPDSDELIDSVVEVDRSDIHSQKPERFYDIIEDMYIQGPYVELFARAAREGWTAWGNETQ